MKERPWISRRWNGNGWSRTGLMLSLLAAVTALAAPVAFGAGQNGGPVPRYVVTIWGEGEEEKGRNELGTKSCARFAAVEVRAVILGGSVYNSITGIADCTYAPSPDATCNAVGNGIRGSCAGTGVQSLGEPTCTGRYAEAALRADKSTWGVTCTFF